jgi:hypothetical protein
VLPPWGEHFAPYSNEVQAQLQPHAANYDECMREWGQNPRTFQKREFHQGDPPTITSAWVFRSPFDRRLKLLSFGWYATGRQASRAHWREVTATQTAHL